MSGTVVESKIPIQSDHSSPSTEPPSVSAIGALPGLELKKGDQIEKILELSLLEASFIPKIPRETETKYWKYLLEEASIIMAEPNKNQASNQRLLNLLDEIKKFSDQYSSSEIDTQGLINTVLTYLSSAKKPSTSDENPISKHKSYYTQVLDKQEDVPSDGNCFFWACARQMIHLLYFNRNLIAPLSHQFTQLIYKNLSKDQEAISISDLLDDKEMNRLFRYSSKGPIITYLEYIFQSALRTAISLQLDQFRRERGSASIDEKLELQVSFIREVLNGARADHELDEKERHSDLIKKLRQIARFLGKFETEIIAPIRTKLIEKKQGTSEERELKTQSQANVEIAKRLQMDESFGKTWNETLNCLKELLLKNGYFVGDEASLLMSSLFENIAIRSDAHDYEGKAITQYYFKGQRDIAPPKETPTLHIIRVPWPHYNSGGLLSKRIVATSLEEEGEILLPLPESLSIWMKKGNSFREWLDHEANKPLYHMTEYKTVKHQLQKILYVLKSNSILARSLEKHLGFKKGDSIVLIIEEVLQSLKVGRYKPVDFFKEGLKKIFDAFISDQKETDTMKTLLNPLQESVKNYYRDSVKGIGDRIENTIYILEKTLESILGDPSQLILSIKKIKNKAHEIDFKESFDQRILGNTQKKYPGSELEKCLLLNENVKHAGTFRFNILDCICTLLRKYRSQIKDIFQINKDGITHKKARIKFRGSLVRNLKGYPKNGVPPTLDNYDCDAFIEVEDSWWSELRNFKPGIEQKDEKTGRKKVSKRTLREYENLEDIRMNFEYSYKWNEQKLETYTKVEQQLIKLAFIQKEIKADILKEGVLKDYAKDENKQPDFGFYLRPISSVKKTYEEGNPYTRKMIENRGYPEYARSLKEEEVGEFKPVMHVYKRPILATIFEPDEKEYKGITLPEYQVVIGKHNWYIENEQLFSWRGIMRLFSRHKGLFSRRLLPIYQEDTLSNISLQRDYTSIFKDTDEKPAFLSKDQRNKQTLANEAFENLHPQEERDSVASVVFKISSPTKRKLEVLSSEKSKDEITSSLSSYPFTSLETGD